MTMNHRAGPLFNWLDAFGAILAVLQFSMAVSLWLAGRKLDGLGALTAATTITVLAHRKILLDRVNIPVAPWIAALRGALLIFLAVCTAIVAVDFLSPGLLAADAASDTRQAIIQLLVMLGWTVIALKGAMVGKLRPNRFVGLRVGWNRQSRHAWERSHRLWGRILFLGALGGLLTSPLLPSGVSVACLLVLVFSAATAALIESHRAWRDDPEKQAT
jgi:hypothetical protein